MTNKFTAYKHLVLEEKTAISVRTYQIGVLVIGISILISFIDNQITPKNVLSEITKTLFIIGALPISVSYIYQYFDYEIIKIAKKGHLEINENEIIIDYYQKISFEEITDFKINFVAYYDERINLYSRIPAERKSLGLNNKVNVITKTQSISLNFKLENKSHWRNLEEVIFNLVIKEKLYNLNAKKSIKLIPKRFIDSDEYKNYVIKQILERKINCTKGLLLHGYKTDKEAKILRQKYCR